MFYYTMIKKVSEEMRKEILKSGGVPTITRNAFISETGMNSFQVKKMEEIAQNRGVAIGTNWIITHRYS